MPNASDLAPDATDHRPGRHCPDCPPGKSWYITSRGYDRHRRMAHGERGRWSVADAREQRRRREATHDYPDPDAPEQHENQKRMLIQPTD